MYNSKKMAVWCGLAFLVSWAACGILQSAETEIPPQENGIVPQLIKKVPDDFPRFRFKADSEEARLLTHFLWYHFHHRLGNNHVLFNKEYLLTADIWLAGARPRGSNETIQDVHRRCLLSIHIDKEGYVACHQHFSHAHDLGWPFPFWCQAHKLFDKVKGKTAGWHFQPLEKVPGWVGDQLRREKAGEYTGAKAASLWKLHNVKSLGIKNNRWHLETTGPSPAITTPSGYAINAFDSPCLQLRWKRSGTAPQNASPYVEWLRDSDNAYSPDRRVSFPAEKTPLSRDCFHSIIPVHRHPKWRGTIKEIRISLAPGERNGTFEIDSFFTVYDTRHTINNPIFILASDHYFRWTGDIEFLRRQINRMRTALRYMQTEMGGLKFNHIRNAWPGHDGLPGWKKDAAGNLTFHSGHGIGSNYWDILPFGWDDMYATSQYYAATLALADLEEAIREHQNWNIPGGNPVLNPRQLRLHAQKVKETANRIFWNNRKGRFIACIDKNGDKHDYGYTFLNLDAIWYDLASTEHAQSIMEWITGGRIIDGDTSTGNDIYRWRFAPRATTLRNIEWYGQGWWAPESLPWGYQVQDGGAVLGFTFYDLWARLKVLGPDNAWKRLTEILAWEKEVHTAGGYRTYYKDKKQGTTLQGGGTCGGLGIDCEFFESSLVPSIITYGFLGLKALPDGGLQIHPRLPAACPEMEIQRLLYHDTPLDIRATNNTITVQCKEIPIYPVRLALEESWKPTGSNQHSSDYVIDRTGVYSFRKPSAVPIIFDTDIGTDVDDAGALAILHLLADRGDAEILATMSANQNRWCAPALDVINTYYGRGDLPVGVSKTGPDPEKWYHESVNDFPHDLKVDTGTPDAVALYRKILAAQPDDSVTIVVVGWLTNMADLLDSKPDRYSPLNGKELVKAKVKELVSMGGRWPNSPKKEGEYNFRMDGPAAHKVISEWPGRIMFTGLGRDVMTGSQLVAKGPKENPVPAFYRNFFKGHKVSERSSWDLIAVLYAVRGLSEYFTSVTDGKSISKNDGSNTWEAGPPSNHAYLEYKMPQAELAELIEELLLTPPAP